jgi:hypothetical protein
MKIFVQLLIPNQDMQQDHISIKGWKFKFEYLNHYQRGSVVHDGLCLGG